MQPPTADYLLAATAAEVERLQIQARAWEPEVETMLNEMGVGRTWRCIDIGCGPIGIIGPLARRTGPSGTVVALDKDALQLRAARQYAESEALRNVEFVEGDLFTVGRFRSRARTFRSGSHGTQSGSAGSVDVSRT